MPRKLEKPNIPPDSCGHIDRVQEIVQSLAVEVDDEMRSGYSKIINEELELIRTINTQLRQARTGGAINSQMNNILNKGY